MTNKTNRNSMELQPTRCHKRFSFVFSALVTLLLMCHSVAYSQSGQLVRTMEELQRAISEARSGDVILMANGIWRDADIDFSARGNAGDSIRLQAQTPGKVILTGNSNIRIRGEYLVVDGLWFRDPSPERDGNVVEISGAHNRLTNTAIVDFNVDDHMVRDFYVLLNGRHHRVDHNYLVGKTNNGSTIMVRGEENHNRIDHNYFARPYFGWRGESITLGASPTYRDPFYTTVEYNLFENADGEMEIISNKSRSNTYRYNTFLRSAGTISLRLGGEIRIEGNFFIGDEKSGTGGIRVVGDDNVIINNYFEGLRSDKFARSPASEVISVHRGTSPGGTPIEAGVKCDLCDHPDPGGCEECENLHRAFTSEYPRVENLLIAFNTFVNNLGPAVNLGSYVEMGWVEDWLGDIGKYVPKGSRIAHNVVARNDRLRNASVTHLEPRLYFEDGGAVDTEWEGNLFYQGFREYWKPDVQEQDPKLKWDSEHQIWGLAGDSPARSAAPDSYRNLMPDDILGRPRGAAMDIGAVAYSEKPALRKPLTAFDVGPSWFPHERLRIRLDEQDLDISGQIELLQRGSDGQIISADMDIIGDIELRSPSGAEELVGFSIVLDGDIIYQASKWPRRDLLVDMSGFKVPEAFDEGDVGFHPTMARRLMEGYHTMRIAAEYRRADESVHTLTRSSVIRFKY